MMSTRGLVGGETLFIWKFSSAAAYYIALYLVRLAAWLISPFVQTVVDPQRYYDIVTEYLATRLAYDNIGPGLFFQFMIIMLFSVVCGNNFSRVFFCCCFSSFSFVFVVSLLPSLTSAWRCLIWTLIMVSRSPCWCNWIQMQCATMGGPRRQYDEKLVASFQQQKKRRQKKKEEKKKEKVM